MSNINLTFNKTTYDFNFCVGNHKNKSYEYYNIYINGERNHDYLLESAIQTKGEKIFILYWKSFGSSCFITNPNNLEEIAKVITYINKNNDKTYE